MPGEKGRIIPETAKNAISCRRIRVLEDALIVVSWLVVRYQIHSLGAGNARLVARDKGLTPQLGTSHLCSGRGLPGEQSYIRERLTNVVGEILFCISCLFNELLFSRLSYVEPTNVRCPIVSLGTILQS